MKSDWPLVKMSDHIDLLTGFPFKSAEYTEDETGIRLLRGDNVIQGTLRWEGVKLWPSAKVPNFEKFQLKAGDVILAMDRPWIEAGLKYAWIKDSDLPCLLVQRVARMRGRATLCTQFLRYIIGNPAFTDHIQPITTGTAVPHISATQIGDYRFALPPLPIQRKIAAVLSAYDDLIENNMRRIAILEEMAQALYREWFVYFRFPGHEKNTLVESPPGPIPAGWEVVRLGDVAQEVRRGVNPETIDPETPYLGLEHLPRKSIALADWGAASEVQSTKLAFKKGEILFGKIRPYFHKVGVAPVDGVCSTDAIVIIPSDEEYFGLVLCCVSSDDFVSHATQTSQGTKMPRADWDVLVQYPVALPPSEIVSQFNTLVRDSVASIQNLIFRNRNLRRTRDMLLPKLIAGEIEVAELAIEIGEVEDGRGTSGLICGQAG